MAKRPDNPHPGLLIVDKPAGVTSHDVVSRVRRLLHTRKVGHGGTLDPMATGVLVIGIGKATKLLTWVSGDTKTYEAVIRLGQSTNTDDADGEITASRGCDGLQLSAIESAVDAFRGEIMQVPSSFSAIKVNGKRAYALSRAGHSVDLAARPVTIHRFDIGQPTQHDSFIDIPAIIECSSGTYIRALARDLGEALGTGGHLVSLRRTRVGAFTLDAAHSLEALESHRNGDATSEEHQGEAPEMSERIQGRATQPISIPELMPLDRCALSMFTHMELTQEESVAFTHGQAPRRVQDRRDDEPIALCSPSGSVLGLGAFRSGRLRTLLVFSGDVA